MRRRLLNLLTLLSLLLCVAVAALWVRSYVVSNWVVHVRVAADGDSLWKGVVATGAGRAVVLVSEHNPLYEPPRWAWETDAPMVPLEGGSSFGFGLERGRSPLAGTWRWWHVRLPLWLPALLPGILPAARLYRRLRRRRHLAGCCPA